jgi:hypothetical protein
MIFVNIIANNNKHWAILTQKTTIYAQFFGKVTTSLPKMVQNNHFNKNAID